MVLWDRAPLCLFVHRGMGVGYPARSRWGGTPTRSRSDGGGGYTSQVQMGGTPGQGFPCPGMGYTPSQGWGTPLSWDGVPPGQDGVPPSQGWGTPLQVRITEEVLATRLAVCLLRSCWRTFSFCQHFMVQEPCFRLLRTKVV